jgi:hypothetical protein
MGNWLVKDNAEYKQELQRRIDLLRSQGFVFIKSNPWESSSILEATDPPPRVDIDHVKWTGDCSWFWWYMFRKHKEQNYVFKHDNKKFEFLYLNKTAKPHRKSLYDAIDDRVKQSSLVSFWPNVKLPSQYENHYPYPERGMDQDIVESQYEDSKYSLLSESSVGQDEVFTCLWFTAILCIFKN